MIYPETFLIASMRRLDKDDMKSTFDVISGAIYILYFYPISLNFCIISKILLFFFSTIIDYCFS